jgi:hypothetical protein
MIDDYQKRDDPTLDQKEAKIIRDSYAPATPDAGAHYLRGVDEPWPKVTTTTTKSEPITVSAVGGPDTADAGAFPAKLRDRFKVAESGCWEWQGDRNHAGYGKVVTVWKYKDRKQKTKIAHRLVYEALVGPIPAGLVIDHLCRNTRCVNPSHLEPVTNKENILRGVSFSAKNARKDTCPWGHPMTEDNVYCPPKHPTHRTCRACQSKRKR